MKDNQLSYTGNVIPFQSRSGDARAPAGRHDNIIHLLDLAKFEQPRPDAEKDASMRANIVAMVLLGLLVFLATEDFCRLERANLCATKSECIY
jgi:hypothetical protein